MANMVASLFRSMQRFFEFDMLGLVKWDTVKVFVPSGGDSAGARFALNGYEYEIVMESSDVNPKYNLGSIFLNDKRIGPIDERTWTVIALEIKKHNIRAVA